VSRLVREIESGCTRCQEDAADGAADGDADDGAVAAKDRPPDDAPLPTCCRSRSPAALAISNAPVTIRIVRALEKKQYEN